MPSRRCRAVMSQPGTPRARRRKPRSELELGAHEREVHRDELGLAQDVPPCVLEALEQSGRCEQTGGHEREGDYNMIRPGVAR